MVDSFFKPASVLEKVGVVVVYFSIARNCC